MTAGRAVKMEELDVLVNSLWCCVGGLVCRE